MCWLLSLSKAVSLVLVLCYVSVSLVLVLCYVSVESVTSKTIKFLNCVFASVCSRFSVLNIHSQTHSSKT